jgi:hypothetical protein
MIKTKAWLCLPWGSASAACPIRSNQEGEPTMIAKIKIAWVILLAVGLAVGMVIMGNLGQQTQAQELAQAGDNSPLGRKPTAIVNGQYPASYFPNTELLGPNELRLTALGTGMPNQTRAAVSISYLVELGNGDKFLFDVGSGMLANLFSLRPDFSKIDKVFASHLHVDHVGDFMAFHVGRAVPARNWAPRPLPKPCRRATPGTSLPAAARCPTPAGRSRCRSLTTSRSTKSFTKRTA